MTPPTMRAGLAGPWPVALLLVLHAGLLLDAARRDTATFDEPLFIAGAVASGEGDRRLFPEGGALPQWLQGLALKLQGEGLAISRDSAAWQRADGNALGFDLLYRSGHDPRRIVFLARLPVVLASLGLGLLVHALARRLFGPQPALVALALHALSPVVLAHGHLATADMLAALTLMSATWCAHACLVRLTWRRLALSCAATGVAFIAKMSAVLLLPIVGVLVLARLVRAAPLDVALGRPRAVSGTPGRLLVTCALVVTHALAAILVIWLAHGLRWSAAPPADPSAPMKWGGWEALAGEDGEDVTARLVGIAREHRILPEAWLFGFQFTTKHAHARRAYAEGRYSLDGWWWFFPRVLVLKTPLAALALAALGLVALASAWRRGERLTLPSDDELPLPRSASAFALDMQALLPLVALFGVVWAAAMLSNLNIGVRHVLPSLPLLSILGAAAWSLAGRAWRVAVPTLVALAILEGLSAHPHHLAWMNAAAGPPAQRWRRVVDSSLDWGQGLSGVREAVDAAGPVHLAYFGVADPRSEGLDVRGLRGFEDRWRSPDGSLPGPGVHVVSATILVQLMSPTCPGPWRPLYEQWWREAERDVRAWREADEAARRDLVTRDGRERWAAALARHDDLATGRLCAFLRHREPDAVIAGGAMLAWRLDAEEVERALLGNPVELVTGIPVPFPIVLYPGTR